MKRHLTATLLALALPAAVFAQTSAVPTLMSYQSRVADAAGVPLGSTAPVNRIVIFRVWDSPGGTAPANRLYSEQQTVTISGGEFSVLVGSGTPIASESANAFSTFSADLFAGATRYLGVTIDDGDGNPANDPELSPRQQIVGTAFSFRSAVAESVAPGGVSALALTNNSVGTAALAAGSVTGAKLAPGAVGPGQIGDAAVGTGQVVDGSLTLAKHAPDSVDSSKILDGSINLTDLSPSLVSIMPKPSVTYDQGLGAFNRGTYQTSPYFQYLVFPIDASDLGVDGEVVISYEGSKKSGFTTVNTQVAQAAPPLISGRVRVIMPNFVGGSAASSIVSDGSWAGNVTNSPGYLVASTGAATTAPTTNIPFLAIHQGMGPKNSYTITGILAQTTALYNSSPISSVVSGGEPDSVVPSGAWFPRTPANWSTALDGSSSQVWSSGSGAALTGAPLAAATVYSWTKGATAITGNTFPTLYIFHYYPGGFTNLPSPYNGDIGNNAANVAAPGPAQTLNVASVQTGTNKLTITVTGGHVVQIGDTVVIAGMTGAPAANASYTVAAVPSPTSFEVAVPGAAGAYSGGTITHTPTYNKYRFWVAVHALYNARVIVSDK